MGRRGGNRKVPGKWRKNAHLWERDPDDWYVEPEWCCDALFAAVRFDGYIADPCCGLGRVLDGAARAGYLTYGFDIKDRGAGIRHRFETRDFFAAVPGRYRNIACNPPYKYDDEFLRRALELTEYKVAVLLRAQWVNAGTRSAWLERQPLRHVLALTPRPSMPPGAVILAGESPGGGQVDYSWFVFERGYRGKPEFGWARRAKRAAPLIESLRESHESRRDSGAGSREPAA